MKNREIHLLVTFNSNYIRPFRTMLCSLINNNPGESVRVWLLHSAIPPEELQALGDWCAARGAALTPLQVDRSAFRDAPVSRQYPQEMYYRLLAPRLLPESVKKVLYLDSDILVLNPMRALWDMDLQGHAFAAASHSGVFAVMNGVNRIRLNTDHDYYNSGVMLMGSGQGAGNRPAGGRFCLRAGSRGGACAAGSGRFQLPVRRPHPAAAGRRVELRRPVLLRLPAAQRGRV